MNDDKMSPAEYIFVFMFVGVLVYEILDLILGGALLEAILRVVL